MHLPMDAANKMPRGIARFFGRILAAPLVMILSVCLLPVFFIGLIVREWEDCQ